MIIKSTRIEIGPIKLNLGRFVGMTICKNKKTSLDTLACRKREVQRLACFGGQRTMQNGPFQYPLLPTRDKAPMGFRLLRQLSHRCEIILAHFRPPSQTRPD